jgi:hypothetical protein
MSSKQNYDVLPTFTLIKCEVSIDRGVAISPEADSLRIRWRRRPSSHCVSRDDLDVVEIITVSTDGEP